MGLKSSSFGASVVVLAILAGCPKTDRPAAETDAGDDHFNTQQDGGELQAPSLALTAVLPASGPATGGTQLILSGRAMREGVRATVQGVNAEVVALLGEATLVVTTPPGNRGAADVQLINPDGAQAALAGAFTYTDPIELTVTSAIPSSARVQGGDTVVLRGTGFLEGARVFFGVLPAASVEVLSADVLVVTTPPAAERTAAVSVENPGGARAVLATLFRFVDINTVEETLSISSVLPARGPTTGQTRVAIVGTGFDATLKVAIGGVETAAPEVRSSSVAIVMTPEGTAGPASVTLTQQGEEAVSLVNGFTYVDNALALTEVLPDTGPVEGGTAVALVGRGFRSGMQVLFGSQPANGVAVLSDTAATATTPAGGAGAVNVTVSLSVDETAVLAGAFTYVANETTLSLTSVSPSSGPLAGGVPAVLGGTRLDKLTSADGGVVRFGDQAAEILELISNEALVVRTPAAAAAGAVAVTVQSPDGQSATRPGAYTYEAEQVQVVAELTGVLPRTGPTTGGTRVAIHGRGLTGVSQVKIGTALASDVSMLGATVISATSPPGAVGAADVTVVLASGEQLLLRRAFFYFEAASTAAPPSVTSIRPALGPLAGGTPFVINGSRFEREARVIIGGVDALNTRHVNSMMLTGVVPAGSRAGAVDVVVMHTDGRVATLAGGFTYYVPDATTPNPHIDEIRPPTASSIGGTQLTMNGTGFLDNAQVFVDGVPAGGATLASSSRIVFTAPAHPAGSVPVSVVNDNGTYFTLQGGLSYVSAAPTLSEVLPSQGPSIGGTGLTIRGVGFDIAAQVRVGNADAVDVVVLDPTLLLAITPPGQPGAVDITVVNPGALAVTAAGAFTYFDGTYADQAPVLTAISPSVGPPEGGSMVLVTGGNFQPGARLLFGNTDAVELTILSPTEAVAVVPPGLPQTVDLVWLNPDGQTAVLRGGFTFADPLGAEPIINGLAPNRGPAAGGTPTVIAGSRFTQGSLVFFDKTPVRDPVVLSSGFISFNTPAHEPGAVPVTVTTAEGISTRLSNAYTFIASPVIGEVNPAVGPLGGGIEVLIGGTNFEVGATVQFGDTNALSAVVASSTVIRAVIPARPLGAVDVTVRNPDGQVATKASGFEYLDVPVITSVWPPSGPNTGGTRAIIEGGRLRNGVRVLVGGVEATGVAWISDNEVSFVVPAGSNGPATIEVINPDGQRATLAGGFSFVDPSTLGTAPTVTTCYPDKGHIDGGTAVRITGTGFAPRARAFFGGAPAETGYMDATRLAARTPPRPAGLVAVDVTLPNGLSAMKTGCFTYRTDLGTDPDPLIGAVQPAQGPTAGGADIAITGDHFQDGAVVLIGARLASSTTFISATRLEARTPPGTEGPADVTVANPDGKTATLPGAYLYLAPPVVLSVTPSEGPSVGGTDVVIRGAGFLQGAVVRVGGVLAANIVIVSDEEITAETPPGTPGVADVTVVNGDGQVGTLAAAFAYTPPPVIDSIDPTSGSTVGDQWVTVRGSGYRAGATVQFGPNASPDVQVLSGTELRAKTPIGQPGTVAVAVINVDGYSDTLPLAFTYIPPPQLFSVSPTSGPEAGGTVATVVGRYIQQGARVYFGNNEAASVTFINSSTLEVTSPARPSGPAAVTVANPDGQQATLPFGFVYLPPIPPPDVTSISPNFGALNGGTLATITGSDFQYGARVLFGTTEVLAANITVLAATQIRARVPAATTDGPVSLRVINPDAQEDTLANAYTYLPALALPPLGLSSITPNRSSLEGGAPATVLGNGFPSDIQFYAVRGSTVVEIPILRYFSAVAVQVQLPAMTDAGLYDLRAMVASTGASTTLAGALEYRANNLTFTVRRGRVPAETRSNDQFPVVADLNLDGFHDVYIPREGLAGTIFQNRGTAQPGYFDDVSAVNLTGEPAPANYLIEGGATVATDVSLDGWPDLVSYIPRTYYYAHHFRVRQSRGFGKIQFGGSYGSFNPGASSDCVQDWVLGDIDRRNGPDVLVCTCREDFWLRNRGLLRDANGDVVNDADGVPVWKGFDTVTFQAVVQGAVRTPSEDTRGCDLGDIDNDGDLDVHFANGNNTANRLYLNDIATVSEDVRITTVDEFTADGWNESYVNGSAAGGIYNAAITNVGDPYIYRDITDFVSDYDNIQLLYKSYTNGPTAITLYYIDSQQCSGWNGLCSQSFPIIADGEWHTLDAPVTDYEWQDAGTIIRQLRIDFDGQLVTGSFQIDSLKFWGRFADPTFIDVSGSPMFNYAGDSRSSRFVDLDHDGDLDIVTINYDQDDYILFNTTDGSGNQVFVQNAGALCHDEACSLAGSSPPLFSKDVGVYVGPDSRMRIGGDPMDPAQRFTDFDNDGCVDLFIEFAAEPWIPRIYLNKKVGDAPQGCTGQFFYAPTDGATVSNPLRNLFHGGMGDDVEGYFGRDVVSNWSNPPSSFADLDADGALDFYQMFRDGQDRVYINKPVTQDSQTYRRLVDSTYEGIMPRDVNRCRGVNILDVNRDGAPDILTNNFAYCPDRDQQVKSRLYLNDGAGNFADASSRLPLVRGRVMDQVVADFTGDGFEDIVMINWDEYYSDAGCDVPANRLTKQIHFLKNDGTGTFVDVTSLTNLGDAGMYYYSNYGLRAGHAVDIDGDGDLDLALVGDNPQDPVGRRRVYINAGDPFNRGAPYFFDQSAKLPDFSGRHLVSFDFDRDGRKDLYVSRGEGNGEQNKLYRNTGGAYEDVTASFMNQQNDKSYAAIVGKFSGSALMDIFVVNDAQHRRLHVGRPDNTLADLTDSNIRACRLQPYPAYCTFPSGGSEGVDARRSFNGRAADVDNDGLLDVVMGAYGDRTALYLNVGNGVFDDFSSQAFPDDAFDRTVDIGAADFDLDGDVDLFLCNEAQQNRLLVNSLR